MKTIKDLDVTITYKVGYGDVKVSDTIYKGLLKITGRDMGQISDDDISRINDEDILSAYDWLGDNINQRYGHSFEYEVDIKE